MACIASCTRSSDAFASTHSLTVIDAYFFASMRRMRISSFAASIFPLAPNSDVVRTDSGPPGNL